MSRTISEISNKVIRELLIDMGFDEYSFEPGWAFDLAERLADSGWTKETK